MLLHISEISSEPLHEQLRRQIRAKILGGDLPEGTPLPSIRALARQQRVSVITVQRAYEDLQHEGLITSHRGKGFFVAPMTNNQKKRLAINRFVEGITPIISNGLAEGLTPEEIEEALRKILSQGGKKS